MKRIALLAAMLALAACGSFGQAQPHTLSLAYKEGYTYKYKFHSSTKQTVVTSGQTVPAQIDMTANESVKVNSVDNGTADVSITFSNLTVKSMTAGITNTTTGMPASSVEVKIAPDGTISSVNGSAIHASDPLAGFSGVGGGFFISAVLPDHPVKPGDKWSKTYDQSSPSDFLTGGSHITSDSTYLRDESLNGVTVAVVETKSTGSIELHTTGALPGQSPGTGPAPGAVSFNGTFTTDVTTWVDPNGHRVVKSHGTAHNQGTIQLPGVIGGQTAGPMLQGPITTSGDSTTDLSPA